MTTPTKAWRICSRRGGRELCVYMPAATADEAKFSIMGIGDSRRLANWLWQDVNDIADMVAARCPDLDGQLTDAPYMNLKTAIREGLVLRRLGREYIGFCSRAAARRFTDRRKSRRA
ncbi:MAG: hypothetical protein J4F41_00130 [Alphaproteobacteria bacterium]|nr:hypothetical protein [Alphaproteobacteria bacterium]